METIVDAMLTQLEGKAHAAGIWAPETVPAKHVIIRQGDAPEHVFVLLSGLVKLTYTTDKGEEWIKSFIADRGLFGPTDELLPTFYGAQSIKVCKVVRLSRRWLAHEISADSKLERAIFVFLDWVRQKKEIRERALLCEAAADRYAALNETEPALLARLPQGDIARYLRITPVAFSRVKRKLKSLA
jgi:CRP-like cAMP-binding protein